MADDEARLDRQLGFLLQRERERRGVTQEGLAERAGVTRQSVSRFESGRRRGSTLLADRLFAGLGLQLRVDVEAAGAHRDEMIEKVRDELPQRRAMVVADMALLSVLHRPGFAYLFDGECVALLHGVPVAASGLDLMVAEHEVEQLAGWVHQVGVRRYDAKARDFVWRDLDPRAAGPLRWHSGLIEFRVRLVAVLPPPVLLAVPGFAEGEEHRVAVRALPAVEADFPEVARVLSRLRGR
ncbi:helix-turn-helix transcriptional regulator [Catellatospora sichuanensis]|uniref:helix-turn-helix transcriptional regulator n=1 Tax=Catellatospora sichuanensis TaxID=1969805 RepID=UPI0011836A28|nr:helix-turn-helix transcriptional regulator [Catellatospora sichuanensis]